MPWIAAASAADIVVTAKASGVWIIVIEQTTNSLPLELLVPRFPLLVVFGGETGGVSKEVIDLADAAASIPMLGMANSLNVSTAAAIVIYNLVLAAAEAGGAP